MEQLDDILCETVKIAKSAGIPVSDKILPKVIINTRRRTILGTCEKQKDGRFKIVISSIAVEAGEKEIRNVIAHEVLHTCKGCGNHGELWKNYAKRLGNIIGQEIKRTGEPENARAIRENAPYVLVCERCGRQFHRFKRSKLVMHPERYKCTCGGKIKPHTQS